MTAVVSPRRDSVSVATNDGTAREKVKEQEKSITPLPYANRSLTDERSSRSTIANFYVTKSFRRAPFNVDIGSRVSYQRVFYEGDTIAQIYDRSKYFFPLMAIFALQYREDFSVENTRFDI